MARSYKSDVRSANAAETYEAILQAAREATADIWLDELTLEDVAQRAGVTVRTIIRRFGSREELIMKMADSYRDQLEHDTRKPPADGDYEGAVRILVESYETDGRYNLRGLDQAERWPFMKEMFARARARHRRFVSQVFESYLAGLAADLRDRKLAELEVATWMTTWRYLRLDLGLSLDDTYAAMLDMVKAVTARTSQ